MSNQYKASGVDIEKGYEAVKRMKSHVQRTFRSEVLSELGGFGGVFDLSQARHFKHPVLVSGTDGVGTKLLLAQQAQQLDTIGIDCVAMCVNDVLAQGAEPLLFLDYLAVGANDPQAIESIVAGVADGCQQAGAALVGGETAEMPDLYEADEFDLAGFCVGLAERDQLLYPERVQAGDHLIGLPSSGIHSNGYSLVRKVFFKDQRLSFDFRLPSGQLLIEALLEPTRIYVADVLPLIREGLIHGAAHITGGGFYENVPRILGDYLQAELDVSTVDVPEIFSTLAELGEIAAEEMYQVFNMGIGMVLAVPAEHVEEVLGRITGAQDLGVVVQQVDQQPTVVLKGMK